jgi:hypothetical protein
LAYKIIFKRGYFMKKALIVILMCMGFFSMVILSCSQNSTSTSASGSNSSTPTPTGAGVWSNLTTTLTCGASLPSVASNCTITLACKTPVDLSSISTSSNNVYIACVAVAKQPKVSSNDTFTINPTVCQ